MVYQAIVDSILNGLRKAYLTDQMLKNNMETMAARIVEYLLTVFIALELNKLNGLGPHPEIHLEYKLEDFYNNAFPKIRWKSTGELFEEHTFLKRQFKADTSKERVDIVILNKIDNVIRSRNGIEVKAINKSKENLKQDILRLSIGMNNYDSTDKNSITSCYSVYIHSIVQQKTIIDNKKQTKEQKKEEQKIKSILKDLRLEFPKLDYDYKYDLIDSNTLEDFLDSKVEYELGDIKFSTGAVYSYVIEISK